MRAVLYQSSADRIRSQLLEDSDAGHFMFLAVSWGARRIGLDPQDGERTMRADAGVSGLFRAQRISST